MNNYSNQKILLRLFRYANRYKWYLYGSVVVALALSWVSSFRPKYIGEIIDKTFPLLTSQNPKLFMDTLIHQCWILVGLVVLETIFSFLLSYYSNVLAQNIIKDIRMQLFEKLIRFKSAYFDKTPLGTLVTRSVSDIETISTVFNDGILLFLGDILRIIFVLVFMFESSIELTIVALMIFPLMYIVTRLFQKAIKKTFSDERTYTSELNSFVQERLSGMNLVQVFNQQNREQKKFSTYNNNLLQANLKTVFYFSIFFPVAELISAVALGLILYYGGVKATSPGVLIAFIFYINMLVRPLRQIADRFNTIQRGFVGAERVFKIIDSDNSIPNTGTLKPEIEGRIEFKNVYFSYIEGEPILKNLSFTVEKGQNIAVVGATGAGKTTIINLISRFYEIQSGAILIDGINIKDIELTYLRENIGMVLQDVFLFNDTLYNNIILGNTSISKEKVKEAAEAIGIDRFIETLPNTYDYMVSERGSSLSVGQRQLISFLRAYVYNPTILILDEATSSIDTLSEVLIQEATDKLTQNRTSIAIAHRLATIQNADVIMVLDKGELVEKGTHKQLMKLEKFYYKLYQSQFQNMEYD